MRCCWVSSIYYEVLVASAQSIAESKNHRFDHFARGFVSRMTT